ncbi:thermonuclease family protein [Mycoplasmopsis hyopharyngis]|uniref:thermonuclease family protein n=1 Tax=Mycoplasmopsis hyopharyngis TaxID=29558 RepID=UPI003872CBED
MKIKTKVLIPSLLAASSLAIIPTISSSCNEFKNVVGPIKANYELDTRIKLDTEDELFKKRAFKAKVTDNSDGDTVTVEALEDRTEQKIEKGKEYKIRLSGIDTPEKAVGGVKSEKREYTYALMSSDFCIKTLSVGKEVIVFADEKDSFGRTVGDVFFDPTEIKNEEIENAAKPKKDQLEKLKQQFETITSEEEKANLKKQIRELEKEIRELTKKIGIFYKSYCVEIVKAGYSLPLTSDSKINATISSNFTTEYYTYYLMYQALKYALDTRTGFFKYKINNSIRKIESIYKIKPIGQGYKFFIDDITPEERTIIPITVPDAEHKFYKNPFNKN